MDLKRILGGFVLAVLIGLIFALLSFSWKSVFGGMYEVADMLFFIGQVLSVGAVAITVVIGAIDAVLSVLIPWKEKQ